MKHSIEDVKLIYDFQFNALKESVTMLAKGMSFYLLITAGLLAYVLTHDIDPQLKSNMAIIAIIVSVFAGIAGLAIAIGIVLGIISMQKLLKENNPDLYYQLKVNLFFLRGKISVIVVLSSIAVILLVFLIGISLL